MARIPLLYLVFTASLLFIMGCATSPPITEKGNLVEIGKELPDQSFSKIGPISAKSGFGCGGFGLRGNFEASLNILKNHAAKMGAQYVLVQRIVETYTDGTCYHNEHTISGIAYKNDSKEWAEIMSNLSPLRMKYLVINSVAIVRRRPFADAESIKSFAIGESVRVVGELPSGWMQVASEGESIGWVHGDSVALNSTVTPPTRQQQAQPIGKSSTREEQAPQSGTGSGFFVSKMGHVITNAHVVKGCGKVTVGDNANKQVPAEIVNTDGSNDLALLKLSSLEMASADSKSLIQKLSIVVVPLASKGLLRSEDVRLGEKVLVAGFPFGDTFSNTIKVTTGVVSATRGAGDNSGQFQLDAAVQPGNSGGPIYDSGGNIVGVVVAQLNKRTFGSFVENMNFGIKASTVMQFIVSSGLSSKKAEWVDEKSTEQLAEIAQNQALMVMCLQ